MKRPFRKSLYLLIGERTRTRAHSRRHSAAVFYLNVFPSFSRCPRSSLQSCWDRFLRNCVMAQRSATSFGPVGGATARWQGGESKICPNNFVRLLVSCPWMLKKLSKVAPRSSNAAESGHVCVSVLLWANSMIFEKAGYTLSLNNTFEGNKYDITIKIEDKRIEAILLLIS